MDQIIGIAGARAVAAAGGQQRRHSDALWELKRTFQELPAEPPRRYRAAVSVTGMTAMVLGLVTALVLVLELFLD